MEMQLSEHLRDRYLHVFSLLPMLSFPPFWGRLHSFQPQMLTKGKLWFWQKVFFCWGVGWKSKDILFMEFTKPHHWQTGQRPLVKGFLCSDWSCRRHLCRYTVDCWEPSHGEWPPSSGILIQHIKRQSLWFRQRLGVLVLILHLGLELSLVKTLMFLWALFSFDKCKPGPGNNTLQVLGKDEEITLGWTQAVN